MLIFEKIFNIKYLEIIILTNITEKPPSARER
jgi:hypothetical protein